MAPGSVWPDTTAFRETGWTTGDEPLDVSDRPESEQPITDSASPNTLQARVMLGPVQTLPRRLVIESSCSTLLRNVYGRPSPAIACSSVFRSIVCPVDFSAHSDRALGYAVDLAALTSAHLTIVHVVDPLFVAASEASGNRDALVSQTEREMRNLLSRIGDEHQRPKNPPDVVVAIGNPAEEILKQVVERQADLIVMGTQGLEGARRLVFGSTTESVLRESRVPVLAVPIADQGR